MQEKEPVRVLVTAPLGVGGKVVNFVKVSHNMFPDSVTKIKLRAFTGCKSLENVTI